MLGLLPSVPRMSELKKFRVHVQALQQLIDESNLDNNWKQVARDALLAWIAETKEQEWIKKVGIRPAEAEYLRNAAVWPWSRQS